MKEYHYLIIEFNQKQIKTWGRFHKSKRKLAKELFRDLKKHCSSSSQFTLVKVRGKKDEQTKLGGES